MKLYPFLSITFFVSAFLYLSFFLTFSLVFHDRGPRRALYVKDLVPRGVDASAKTSPINVQDFLGYFFFEEGSSSVELDNSYLDDETLFEALSANLTEPGLSRVQRKNRNARTLDAMMRTIAKLDRHVSLEILLCGHTNEKELGQAARRQFEHNRGLAQDRADWVEDLIERELPRDRSVTFKRRTGSTGDQYIEALDQSKIPKGFDPKLLVEVSVRPQQGRLDSELWKSLEEKQKQLELLDYLYFMVYTITTTGYGDMVPVSPEAKIITIMANLLEVFFLVIFFNIILASIRPGSVFMGFQANASKEKGDAPQA